MPKFLVNAYDVGSPHRLYPYNVEVEDGTFDSAYLQFMEGAPYWPQVNLDKDAVIHLESEVDATWKCWRVVQGVRVHVTSQFLDHPCLQCFSRNPLDYSAFDPVQQRMVGRFCSSKCVASGFSDSGMVYAKYLYAYEELNELRQRVAALQYAPGLAIPLNEGPDLRPVPKISTAPVRNIYDSVRRARAMVAMSMNQMEGYVHAANGS